MHDQHCTVFSFIGRFIEQCRNICRPLLWRMVLGFQVNQIFAENAFDVVMHFAAVAYVGESMAEPLR